MVMVKKLVKMGIYHTLSSRLCTPLLVSFLLLSLLFFLPPTLPSFLSPFLPSSLSPIAPFFLPFFPPSLHKDLLNNTLK